MRTPRKWITPHGHWDLQILQHLPTLDLRDLGRILKVPVQQSLAKSTKMEERAQGHLMCRWESGQEELLGPSNGVGQRAQLQGVMERAWTALNPTGFVAEVVWLGHQAALPSHRPCESLNAKREVSESLGKRFAITAGKHTSGMVLASVQQLG